MRADHAFLLSRRPVPARRPSRAAGPRALRDVVTRSLALRARVEPRPEPRFDRLYDPLVADGNMEVFDTQFVHKRGGSEI